MKQISKGAILAATVALGLTLSACDSQAENAQEAGAQDVREAGEATADSMENQADAARDAGAGEVKADAMENKADAVREGADAKADAMEDNADKRDATPE